MDDLYKRLERLRDLLKAVNFKSRLDPPLMVPSIKTPEIKMPSMRASNVKIPGVAPNSKKDPKKIAEQLKNPRPTKPIEALKLSKNGQWSLHKEEEKTVRLLRPPSGITIDPDQEGFGDQHNGDEQKRLIHGLDMTKLQPIGDSAASPKKARSENHAHSVVVKKSTNHPNRYERGHLVDNFNSSRREVMYHNMARDFFKMGNHVPLTAGFNHDNDEWSGQKMISKSAANHAHLKPTPEPDGLYDFEDKAHHKALLNAYKSGDIHKMAIMDNIMGHHDRHTNNYLIGKTGKIHLIDNGTSFDYVNFDPKDVPRFLENITNKNIRDMGLKDKKLHPRAQKWLMGLKEEDALRAFSKNGYSPDHAAVKGFMARLSMLKHKVQSNEYNNVATLLGENRLSSGPLYPHEALPKKEIA